MRLVLLLTSSFISLGLLGVAFSTNWWTIPLEKVIFQKKILIILFIEILEYSSRKFINNFK
jgi:predicted small integral membrane protein